VDFLIERVRFDADYMEGLCPNHTCCEAELELAAAAASSIASRATEPQVALVAEA
jgi:hypothetical protein